MKRPAWRSLPAATAAFFFLIAAPALAQDQPQKPPSPAFLQGTEAFRRVLYDAGKDFSKDGFTPLKTFGDLYDPKTHALNDPRHTLVIVLGGPDRLAEIPGGLEKFTQGGGALFLATDERLSSEGAEFAVGSMTGFVPAGQLIDANKSSQCYRQLASFPFLQPEPEASPDLFRNVGLEVGLSTVATNAPSYLERANLMDDSWRPKPLAWLPDSCGLEGTKAPAEGLLLFAVGGDVGDEGGRILLLADHSIFINEMIMQTDNGNLDFSYNCLKWMAEGKNGPRTRVLFVEGKKIQQQFDVPLREMPDGLMRFFVDFLNHLGEIARKGTPILEQKLRSFDESDGFDAWIWTHFHDKALVFLTVVLAVLVVLYGCWKIGWKGRHRSDLQGPLLASVLHRLAPTGTVSEQRRQSLIRGDNLWEPARDLARQCLVSAGGSQTATLPPVAVRGGWLRRWTTAGRLRRLWRLAYGPPLRVRLNDWRRLLREVQELKTAFADGTVQWRRPAS